MYLDYYALQEAPFALTPDPRFLYFTPSHTEVMASLHYGIESGKGMVVVTGEVGTGKTTILRWLLNRLDRSVLVAYIFNPRLTVPEFYQHLAALLNLTEWESKSDLLLELGRTVEARHARGLRTVIIVDEAQGLSPHVLEEIRLLLNFETDTSKQLQIILTGQPELRNVINNPVMRQLKQRISLRCDVERLPDAEETEKYIMHRLLVAGARNQDLFTPEAITMIHRCTDGIPRQINNLCDNALLVGYGLSLPVINRRVIEICAEKLDMLPRSENRLPREERAVAPGSVLTDEGRAELMSAQAHNTAATEAADAPVPTHSDAPPFARFETAAADETDLGSAWDEELNAAFRLSGLGRER